MADTGDAGDAGNAPNGLASLEVRRIKAAAHAKLFGEGGAHPQKIARYTVLQQLGVGGMGEVYLAYDGELGRKVAIKLVRLDRDSGLERASTRLLREAQALAQLSHPNVVQVYETGRFEGRVFIAMEFVRGVHMRRWLDLSARTWRQVLDAYMQAGQGLAAAHRRGMVHRDFKPENVLVGEDGRVRVVDFGLVRSAPEPGEQPVEIAENASADDLERSSRLTQSGALMGTPSYMSPEQFQGLKATAKSDQFAFCVALYRGLYGWHPFASETRAELKRRVLTGLITPPPRDAGVPAGIYTVLVRGLHPDPEQRHPSMEALLAALASPPNRKRRLGLAVGGALVACCALVFGLAGQRFGGACAIEAPAGDRDLAGALQQSFARSGLPYAGAVARRAAAQLERRAAAIARARAGVCAGPFADDRLRDRHEACVERRRREFDVVTDALARLRPESIAEVERLIESLPSLAPCYDPDALAGPDPAPPERLETLDEARVLALVGRLDDASTLAKRVYEQAGSDGPLRAEALALLGRLAFVRGAPAEGRNLLEDAHDQAVALRDDDLAADIVRDLAGFTREDHHARHALAAAERLRDPPRLVAAALMRAEIALDASNHRTVDTLLSAALSRADQSPATAAEIELLMARSAAAQAMRDSAARHLERALALGADRPRHPALADALEERARLELDLNHRDVARLRFGEALAVHDALPGHEAALARLHLALADLARAGGERARAHDHYRSALALAGGAPDLLPRHEIARALDALAELSSRPGDPASRSSSPPSTPDTAPADPRPGKSPPRVARSPSPPE